MSSPEATPGRQADNPEIIVVNLDDDTRRAAATRCTIHAAAGDGYAETHDSRGNLIGQTGPDVDTLPVTADTASIRLLGSAYVDIPDTGDSDE